ncbi:MAG: type II toxin-antitoxin system CcdA family antitoxin [Planctomycetia bacterium]|nr:type II toxin-antitoxin system CcdA family antitoxin [Planctomycetia bacterium]MDO4574981.1 type II toxin-antitoxin system CcdA family antitoxin [Planctomycetia bacterium]
MTKNKPKRVQVTTTLDAEILERVRQQPEPLSKFLDRAIANELSRSANAASRLAEAIQEVIQAAISDAIEERRR